MQPSYDQSTDRRVTVAEAAAILGVTPDAVRSRLRRGTLSRDEAPDGTVLVVFGGETTDGRDGPDQSPNDRTTDQTTVAYIDGLKSKIDLLERELRDWKEEARRKDHLLAAALERIPAIEAPPDTAHQGPSEPRESPVSGEEGSPYGTSPQDAEESLHHIPYGGETPCRDTDQPRVPWWRRWFGL
jgi:hypothetical protein